MQARQLPRFEIPMRVVHIWPHQLRGERETEMVENAGDCRSAASVHAEYEKCMPRNTAGCCCLMQRHSDHQRQHEILRQLTCLHGRALAISRCSHRGWRASAPRWPLFRRFRSSVPSVAVPRGFRWSRPLPTQAHGRLSPETAGAARTPGRAKVNHSGVVNLFRLAWWLALPLDMGQCPNGSVRR